MHKAEFVCYLNRFIDPASVASPHIKIGQQCLVGKDHTMPAHGWLPGNMSRFKIKTINICRYTTRENFRKISGIIS